MVNCVLVTFLKNLLPTEEQEKLTLIDTIIYFLILS